MTLINNVTLTPMLKDEAYEGKVGIAFPPYNTTKANFSGCNMLFIGRDCQNMDAAFSYIEAALSEDEVLRRAEELFVPVVRSSLVDEYAAMDPMNAIRAECVEYGVGMPLTTGPPPSRKYATTWFRRSSTVNPLLSRPLPTPRRSWRTRLPSRADSPKALPHL